MMDETINGFLDRLAQRQPTPGGGSVAALAGALAACMARMAAAYSVGNKTEAAKAERVHTTMEELARADALLRELVSADAAAYETMTATAAEKGRDSVAYAAAVRDAAGVPLQIAAMTGRVLEILNGFSSDCSKYLISDLGVAAVLADATVRAAGFSVRINLSEIADRAVRDRMAAELEAIIDRASGSRRRIEDFVMRQIAG